MTNNNAENGCEFRFDRSRSIVVVRHKRHPPSSQKGLIFAPRPSLRFVGRHSGDASLPSTVAVACRPHQKNCSSEIDALKKWSCSPSSPPRRLLSSLGSGRLIAGLRSLLFDGRAVQFPGQIRGPSVQQQQRRGQRYIHPSQSVQRSEKMLSSREELAVTAVALPSRYIMSK